MNDLLLSCETQVEAYEVIASSAGALFVGCSGGLAIREATAQNLRVVATWGHERTLPATFLSDACWALRRGEPYEVADPPHSIHCQHFTTPPAYAYLCVPLTVRGETFGLLQVSAATDLTGEAFHEWRTLILKVSGSIKLALSNLKLREALREQAIHDALTGNCAAANGLANPWRSPCWIWIISRDSTTLLAMKRATPSCERSANYCGVPRVRAISPSATAVRN